MVKEALAVGVSREEEWSRKSSTICECRDILNEVEEICMKTLHENIVQINLITNRLLKHPSRESSSILSTKKRWMSH